MQLSHHIKAKLTLILGLLICVLPLSAASISGNIFFDDDNKPFIQLSEGGTHFKLKFKSPNLKAQIKNLAQNDFISAIGDVKWVETTVVVNSIRFVGLQRLLGSWTSETNETFEFENYENLIVKSNAIPFQARLFSTSQSFSDCLFPVPMNPSIEDLLRDQTGSHIRYQISPRREDGVWPILMITPRSVEVGQLAFQGQKLELLIFDMQTGDISKQVMLSPEGN